jgi:hypothetical protein
MAQIRAKSQKENESRELPINWGKASSAYLEATDDSSMVGLETGFFPETKSSISRRFSAF